MFNGQSVYNIDDKGRVIFPAAFRASMGLRFHITKGLGKCLFVFRKEEWDAFNQALMSASFLDPNARRLQLHFCGSATEAHADGQNRVPIPQALREYAGIESEVVIVGAANHIELWSPAEWKAFTESISEEALLQSAQALGMVPSSHGPATA